MRNNSILACFLLWTVSQFCVIHAFTTPTPLSKNTPSCYGSSSRSFQSRSLYLANENNNNNEETVTADFVELTDDDDDAPPANDSAASKVVAPFLSQGELAEDVLNPNLNDPKQTRVIIYIIISLIPVLFLVPLMLGSRDLIPLDPVQM